MGRQVGMNLRRWMIVTPSMPARRANSVPSGIIVGTRRSRPCEPLTARSHAGLDAHHSAPSPSTAVANGDNAARARNT